MGCNKKKERKMEHEKLPKTKKISPENKYHLDFQDQC
jgi:hypothetical protein